MIFENSLKAIKSVLGSRKVYYSSGVSDFETNWRNKLDAVASRDRAIDANFKERTNNKRVFICQQLFRIDQYHDHGTCKTMIPRKVPEVNLPVKSLSSANTKLRPSVESNGLKTYQFTTIDINYYISKL